jgi:YD repeat-containing protein
VTRYEYERVAVTGPGEDRYREEDFDGRIRRITRLDSEAAAGERVITRVKQDAAHVLMTYPGGVEVLHSYDGEDLTEVSDLSTGRTWVFDYDDFHNLTATHTPAEPTGEWLTQSVPTYSGAHITETLVKVRNDFGALTDRLQVKFNTRNLPYEITA